jgi:hypothetical protein
MRNTQKSLEERIQEAHAKRYDCRTWEHIEYDDRTRIGEKVHMVGEGCSEHHVFVERR